jgi:hypothetical protein
VSVLENTELLETPPEYPMEPERLSPSIVLLFPFVVGALTVTAQIGGNVVVLWFGVLCAVAFVFGLIRNGLKIPREVAIFVCFVIWASLGIFSAYSPSVFVTMYWTLVQILLMVLIITHFTSNTKMTHGMLFAVLTGAAIVAISAYTSGEYGRSEGVGGVRVGGIIGSSHSFAMTMVYSAGIILYLFKTAKSWLMKGVYIATLPIIGKLVIASGSRMGFLSFVALGGVWYCLSYIREIKEKPAKTLGILILLIIGMVVLFSSLSNTTMAGRLKNLTDFLHGHAGPSSGSVEERHSLVIEGISLIVRHPVIGIGLSQFILISSSHLYSHSNYIEMFACTGVIGGLIYYSLYIVLYLRLRRVGKMIADIKGRELVCLAKTTVIIMCLSDIVNISYYSKMHWIILAIFIGWAYHIERELTSNNAYISTEDEFAVTEDR